MDLTQGTCVNGRELWLWESIHPFLTPLPRRLNLDLLELKHGEQTTEVDLMSSQGYTAHRLEGKHSCSPNTALTFRVTWGKNLLAPYTLVWAAAKQMGDSAARRHPHPLPPRPSLSPCNQPLAGSRGWYTEGKATSAWWPPCGGWCHRFALPARMA